MIQGKEPDVKIGRQKGEIVGKSPLELPTIGPSGKQILFSWVGLAMLF